MATTRTISVPAAGVIIADWSSLAAGENGDTADVLRWISRTVQVTGTFGTSTVSIQGSNDGTNWFALSDSNGTTLGLLAVAVLKGIEENPRFIRPIIAAGSGTGFRILIVGTK